MQLAQLMQGLDARVVQGQTDIFLTDLTDDSRTVRAGGLFIARSGSKSDGGKFVTDAVAKGAGAILSEAPAPADLPGSVAWVRMGRIDNALVGELAERFFGRPSRKLKLIGLTGTNGKTTTAFLIQHLLNRAGCKCGLIGTVVIDDGRSRQEAQLTTPGAVDFSRYLAAMVAHGCQAAVAEVSSHALHQGRTAALQLDVGVFTNLTGDHLDYHKTMEEYAAAKAILFESLLPQGWAVVNADDPYAGRMVRDTKAQVLECRVAEKGACGSHAAEEKYNERRTCLGTILEMEPGHSRVRLDGPWGSVEVNLPLVGKHNVYNALEALAAANCVSAMSRLVREGMETCPAPPGRLEPVTVPSGQAKPTVLVDYAHTHDALENVLSALRPLTKGKLVVVFGCGGDRDRTKRPKMAAVACRLADRVVVTSDNPRTEEPGAIIDEILTGVPEGTAVVDPRKASGCTCGGTCEKGRQRRAAAKVVVEPDRAAAIAMAIREAQARDVVLLAGKGHENYQIVGTVKRHFDDREEAGKALGESQKSEVGSQK